MSLGGYKFAGRYCQKGSLTDAQWALKMHKTKVAAFMAANTLSGAGWDYDMTGSPDGNYHCLDSEGNNYVTVFKRTNGENDYAWFALYTLGKISSAVSAGYATVSTYRSYFGSTTNMYIGGGATNFVRIGQHAISYDDSLSQPIDGTSLIFPVGNISFNSSIDNSSTANTLIGQSSAFFGYAVKQSDIVIFSGKDISSICISAVSGNAFSSLYNAGDSMACCILNFQAITSTYSSCYESASRFTQNAVLCGPSLIPNDTEFSPYGRLFAVPQAQFNGLIEQYPFQAIQTTSSYNTATHIYGKGTLKIEFVAYNSSDNNAKTLFSASANGNYLPVSVVQTAWTSNAVIRSLNTTQFTDGYNSLSSGYPALYVGWDPSNPDITQSSSWTEYTD